MRSAALLSFALSSLALFASANPEPCSDHPGVVHAPGEYTVPNVLKLVQPKNKAKPKSASKHHKAKSSTHKGKSSSSSTHATKTKAIVKVAATHKAASTSRTKPSWAKSTKAVHKASTPKVKDSTTKTVVKGASDAIGSFANASYIPPKAANALQKGACFLEACLPIQHDADSPSFGSPRAQPSRAPLTSSSLPRLPSLVRPDLELLMRFTADGGVPTQ